MGKTEIYWKTRDFSKTQDLQHVYPKCSYEAKPNWRLYLKKDYWGMLEMHVTWSAIMYLSNEVWCWYSIPSCSDPWAMGYLLRVQRSNGNTFKPLISVTPLVSYKIIDHSDAVGAFAYRRCPNYIFILDLTPGFNGLGKDNSKMRRETFKFWVLVHLI